MSYKATGGDVSKIKTIIVSKTGVKKIDYSAWIESINTVAPELVELQNIRPVYEFIKDPVKQAEVKKYFEEYLAKNEPRVLK